MKNINEMAGIDIAFAYNNEDVPTTIVSKINTYLHNIPIIIITQ